MKIESEHPKIFSVWPLPRGITVLLEQIPDPQRVASGMSTFINELDLTPGDARLLRSALMSEGLL